MATTNTGPKGLLDLPTELLEFIIEEGTYESMYNLRLTCKDLQAKSDWIFPRVCFSERSFFITSPMSIAVLLKISETEQLAKKIHTINFSLAELRECVSEFAESYLSRTSDRGARARTREYERNKQLMFEQHRKYCQGSTSRLHRDLVRIFQNFMAHDSIPTVVAKECDTFETAGFSKMRKALGYKQIMSTSWDRRPVEILWQAMVEVQFPVRELEIGNGRQSVPLDVIAPNSGFWYLNMSELEHLDLTIFSNATIENREEWKTLSTYLCVVLKSASKLKSLYLTLDQQGACPEFHEELVLGIACVVMESKDGSYHLPELKVLRLDGIQIDKLGYYHLLKKLRPECMDEISVTNIPEWEEEIVTARQMILQKLEEEGYASDEVAFLHLDDVWTRDEPRRLEFRPHATW